jgi:hypothetical protein
MESSQWLRHYGPTVIFRPSCWRARRPDFYRVHQMIRPPSTNQDRNLVGSKDCPHISLSTNYYRSAKFFLKKNHHIQFKKIITYEIIWLIEHTTKCWARLSTYCCTPFWRSWLLTCISTSSSIGIGSHPRDVACKEKNYSSCNWKIWDSVNCELLDSKYRRCCLQGCFKLYEFMVSQNINSTLLTKFMSNIYLLNKRSQLITVK